MSWRAIIILAAFTGLQLTLIDYGVRVNDAPHLLPPISEELRALQQKLAQPAIVDQGERGDTNRALAMVRFRLYSIDADEMVNLMALSRLNPTHGQFDPHFYMYGGAYLYPLGIYYFLLQQLGILPSISLESLLRSPAVVDQIYIAGRVYVLTAFAASAVIFWQIVKHLANQSTADFALLIYLFAPASIMFSNVMKPHWFALLPANAAAWLLLSSWNQAWSFQRAATFGVLLGLIIGSATTYAPLVGTAVLGLGWLWYKQQISSQRFAASALAAVLTFVLTNPYVFLNRAAAETEAQALAGWYQLTANPVAVWLFIKNSLLAGFGLVAALGICLTLWQLHRPNHPVSRTAASAILLVIIVVGLLSHNVAVLHVNARLVPYLLPLLVAFVAWHLKKHSTALLLVSFLTVAQSIPLIVAYADENNPRHSTRLQASTWINHNIPPGSKICAQLSPYNAPPFDFTKFEINPSMCEYSVVVEREPDYVSSSAGRLVQRFTPRLNNPFFPLVFNHINPQISIYQP